MESPLGSWKEIATYLGRSVRTVQRWEVVIGLPVHHASGSHRSVLAYPSELSDWITGNRAKPMANRDIREQSAILRARARKLRKEVTRNIRTLQQKVQLSADLGCAGAFLAAIGSRHGPK